MAKDFKKLFEGFAEADKKDSKEAKANLEQIKQTRKEVRQRAIVFESEMIFPVIDSIEKACHDTPYKLELVSSTGNDMKEDDSTAWSRGFKLSMRGKEKQIYFQVQGRNMICWFGEITNQEVFSLDMKFDQDKLSDFLFDNIKSITTS